MKKLFGFLTLALLLSLTGCETVKGFGQDLKNTGDNIHDAIKKI